MVQGVLDAIRSAPPVAAYALIALLVLGEAAAFVGFVLPGEAAVLVGGLLAHQGHLSLGWLVPVVVVSAIVGDTIGYEVGRRWGPRLLELRVLRSRRPQLDWARDALRRRGGPAVFAARWTAFFRAVMPAMAGLSRMRYGTFLRWNALGGVAWGTTFCLVGYFAGAAYERVASGIGAVAAGVVVVAGLVAFVVWRRRRRHGLQRTS